MPRDHLKLQFIVILWGFTAVLGQLIHLSAVGIVTYRTGLAALCLLIWLRSRSKISARQALVFTITGFVIGAHWITFFLAVKVANVSICMVGVATLSLWTAILEPLLIKKRKLRPIDLIFGAVILVGVAIIYRSELEYSHGFLIAILSAFLAAAFSIVNSFHITKAHHLVITLYEMAGACLFSLTFLLILEGEIPLPPRSLDWLWLIVLAVFCTVVAFSQYIELLKRLSVFTVNFANNLEPVYGILLASLILQEHKNLNPGFYLGASIIVFTIAAYPIVRRRFTPTHP
ncbi:MAG: EamA family transporter [Akkermansiaceae bacterium]|nr:EamA family transporter [Akkermansiaceae bacterium]